MLGPLLFLIYMNNIAKGLPGEKIKLFADHTNLFIFDKDSKLVCTKETDSLNKLQCIWVVSCQQINTKLNQNLLHGFLI